MAVADAAAEVTSTAHMVEAVKTSRALVVEEVKVATLAAAVVVTL